MVIEHYVSAYAQAFSRTDRNLWNYEDGCVLIGLNALHQARGDERYFQALRMFIDRYIGQDGTIRLYNPKEYNIDYIPAGRVLFPLYERTGLEKYRAAAESLMNQLRTQPRTTDGSFWHKGIYPNQVWLDGLYMGLPFYAMYETRFGSGDSFDDILRQFVNCRRHLYSPEDELYCHAYCESRDIFWCDKETGLSPNFWTRAIGWHLMAFADVYELLPGASQQAALRALWLEAMDGMLKRRDPRTGLFWQLTALPDQPGNYLETSGSLMVAYSLMKGARLGVWPDERYARTGVEILMAIEARMFRLEDGQLHLGGICKGAGLGPEGNYRRDGSIAYYLSEQVVEDEQKGVGVCMMAYAEYLRLQAATPGIGPRAGLFTQPYDPIMPEEIARLEKEKQKE